MWYDCVNSQSDWVQPYCWVYYMSQYLVCYGVPHVFHLQTQNLISSFCMSHLYTQRCVLFAAGESQNEFCITKTKRNQCHRLCTNYCDISWQRSYYSHWYVCNQHIITRTLFSDLLILQQCCMWPIMHPTRYHIAVLLIWSDIEKNINLTNTHGQAREVAIVIS